MAKPWMESSRTDQAPELPDVSDNLTPAVAGRLDRVGMTDIEMPILREDAAGRTFLQPARVTAFVSLDQPEAKGIHMSRLYLTLQENLPKRPLNLALLKDLLLEFIAGQKGLSRSSEIRIEFSLLAERAALVSGEKGWRQYPVFLAGRAEGAELEFSLGADVLYSSTCPCSAALARQLVQDRFREDHHGRGEMTVEEIVRWLGREESIVATPHAQRSRATVEVKVKQPHFMPDLLEIIDRVETALGTPVQAAVKRQDEQEFARRNGQNLMFCEDAARRIKPVLDADVRLMDYRVSVEHVESLHPHSAVAKVVKGVAGGFSL